MQGASGNNRKQECRTRSRRGGLVAPAPRIVVLFCHRLTWRGGAARKAPSSNSARCCAVPPRPTPPARRESRTAAAATAGRPGARKFETRGSAARNLKRRPGSVSRKRAAARRKGSSAQPEVAASALTVISWQPTAPPAPPPADLRPQPFPSSLTLNERARPKGPAGLGRRARPPGCRPPAW